jgi:hypothetical protein
MSEGTGYQAVMARQGEIMQRSVGIDYERYATGALAFDYEGLLEDTGYEVDEIRAVQAVTAVGDTPLIEVHNITALVRAVAHPGKGARIFVKDEAKNPSGSFKDRRASLSVHEAKKRGYPGVAAATSGNYGAAVASQAAKAGLRCIVVQEAFDSRHPPLGGAGAVLLLPAHTRGHRLFQRVPLHPVLRSWHRDPRL